MSFEYERIDRDFDNLRRQVQSGELSEDEFRSRLQEMSVRDPQGRLWMKNPEGRWYYNEGGRWLEGDPRSITVPSPSYAPPPPDAATHYSPPAGSLGGAYVPPPVTPGTVTLFYILSFLFPIVGIIFYFVYRTRPHESDKRMARNSLFIGVGVVVAEFLLLCLCVGLSALSSSSS
ncbi:MAG: hypothetical protein M3281_08545 [Chloroflexota bacterium]|nr:hypothetical protein [Chloroflexota bacterium]